eukprot:900443-Lingulodinium_polyedra.AAC.1
MRHPTTLYNHQQQCSIICIPLPEATTFYYNTLQYSTILYNTTLQYYATLSNTLQRPPILYNTLQYSA